MTVYFAVPRTDNTKVKIGFTKNVKARQSNMSVSIPGGVTVLATMSGGKETESYLHEKFAGSNIGGEWFARCDELDQFIRDVQNRKPGIIPFVDVAEYYVRDTAHYSEDAVSQAKEMADSILRKEFRGPGDTIDAALARIETRHGIKSNVFRRMRYREKADIWAGEFLHIKAIYGQRCLVVGSTNQEEDQ